MNSDFKIGSIEINPGEKLGYQFKFPIATSATANNGCIPYGRTISSADVTIYSEDGTDVSTFMIDGTPQLSGEIVEVIFTYPDDFGDGRYKIIFELTLDNGWVATSKFDTLYAVTL